MIDPYSLNKQGNDVGIQYRSGVIMKMMKIMKLLKVLRKQTKMLTKNSSWF